jgi:hypothetical protein
MNDSFVMAPTPSCARLRLVGMSLDVIPVNLHAAARTNQPLDDCSGGCYAVSRVSGDCRSWRLKQGDRLSITSGRVERDPAIVAGIGLIAYSVPSGHSLMVCQARIAKQQAGATLGDVTPLIFLDSRTFENPQTTRGRASLTLVNQNRRDIRLIEIAFKTDAALAVSVDSGEMRDIIAAAYQRSRKHEDAPLIIDLREEHHVIQGKFNRCRWCATQHSAEPHALQ